MSQSQTTTAPIEAQPRRTTPAHVKLLRQLGACEDSIDYAKTHPDAATAWAACERGDWLLWYAGRVAGPAWSESRRRLVLAAAECARLALPIFEARRPGDDRVRKCLDLCERWGRGEDVPQDDLIAARRAADAYGDADADAYAAADAYAYAAAYAAPDRSRVLKESADLVRKHYPSPPDRVSR